MFNFTGNARKPRNVNLSGRPSTDKKPSLAQARQERQQREAQRRRLKAATDIQRTWRGSRAAQLQRQAWRRQWDELVAGDLTVENVPLAVTLFLAFFERGRRQRTPMKWEQGDADRLGVMAGCLKEWAAVGVQPDNRLRHLLKRLARVAVAAVGEGSINDEVLEDVLGLLAILATRIPAIADPSYYTALARVSVSGVSWTENVLEAVVAPLGALDAVDTVYPAFASKYLTTPNLTSIFWDNDFEKIRSSVDLSTMTAALLRNRKSWEGLDVNSRLWMLAYIIYFSRHTSSKTPVDLTRDQHDEDKNHILLLSLLLSSVAVEIGQRIEVEDISMDESDDEDSGHHRSKRREPLPVFVKSQLQSLVQQSAISLLLSKTKVADGDAKALAGFALTLLLVFPSRRSEIRLWLCLAETLDGVPAVRYFWKAVRETSLFADIVKDTKITVERLRYSNTNSPEIAKALEEEWNLILLFLEIYGFLLSVTDDNEFFSGESGPGKERQLPLPDVKEMTVFLKNLAFAMYWYNGEIMGEDKANPRGGEVYFADETFGRSWEVKYLRSTVTNVLRMIYTRDSRRTFLPKNHWLMTDRFNMEGFIPTVVQEEENRQQQLEEDEDKEDDGETERDIDPEALAALTPHARRNLELQRRAKIQQRKQRRNYLASIAPRLEILQNLPFFIPFATRVQIFREFVQTDQKRRRFGDTDPDHWRAHILRNTPNMREALGRHHAQVRRGQEFEDAFDHYWSIGEGLKEPIQITFVDKWGQEEAGIDGGGVTKEFLTSVCHDAFMPPDDEALTTRPDDDEPIIERRTMTSLFRSNDQHLLYPNPTALDEERYAREKARLPVQEGIKALLDRYEFLGRILGKCLYEGILVDISFAPFFLLKWSAPSTAAAYTAVGINDLKDLDGDLYSGLITLRNYPGDVEADFGLTFAVDTIIPGTTKSFTTPLKPGGENITVTKANRLEYIHLMSRYRLAIQPGRQTNAFLRGLAAIIKPGWLQMFNQSELQTLVGGDVNHPIDVEDWRRNTEYSGVYAIGDDGQEHPTIKMFWKAVREMSEEERRNLLKFVTSVKRAPLLGFGVLRPRFSIRDAGSDETRLCSASTCTNLLKMPRYSTYVTLKQKVLYSVNAGAGFDLS